MRRIPIPATARASACPIVPTGSKRLVSRNAGMRAWVTAQDRHLARRMKIATARCLRTKRR